MSTSPGTRLSVCISVITYQRPDGLRALLASLAEQEVPEGVRARIHIVDNDAAGSARPIAEQAHPWPISYSIESDPGIPAARRRSVADIVATDADALIFVDDDEYVTPGWLAAMLDCWQRFAADVVAGPLLGDLPAEAPAWASVSDVFHRSPHPTGTQLTKAYTHNTLVSRRVLEAIQPSFSDAFRDTGSSDLHYFLRVAQAGFRIIWCQEALAIETVSPDRLSLRWLLRRAYRAGAGDSISRRLMDPSPRSLVMGVARGGARSASGLALMSSGVVLASPARRIKGVRRVASGVGTLAGLAGLNHSEYAREQGRP